MSLLDTASLIVTPNGYKEGKLYSVIPSDGSGDMSVVRATTATRVNSAGLVELVPYNLLTYSEQFNINLPWQPYGGVTITPNDTTAPNGTLTADKFNVNGVYNTAFSFAQNTAYSLSFYIKKDTATSYTAEYVDRSGPFTGGSISYNFTTQAITVTQSPNSSVSGISENLPNGWVRLVMTFTTNVAQNYNYIATGFIGGSGWVWGAQLVEGSTAKDYQKTETRLNIPRLDYSNGTCPSLLVEPQRTNVILNSENFSNASWGTSQCSISANQTTSPDGTQNADKLIEDTSTGIHEVYSNTTFSLTAGVTYTNTIYAKSAERTQISLNFVTSGFGQGASVIANLSNGTLGTVNNVGGVTGSTATIMNVGNGWYRISLTMTPASTTNFYADFSPALNGAISYTGNGTSGLFIWGAQLEVGSYPTSYIPTQGASVTRNADVISKTGISSLIGQTEGTLFCEVLQMGGNTIVPFQLSDTTNNNRAQIEISGLGAPLCVVSSGGVNAAVIIGSSLPFNQYHKIAVTYKANEFKLYVDGTLVGTDTSGAVPISLTAVYIGSESGTPYAGFEMKSAVHWKQVLTNDQLIALTTI